jgi:hypothetical protein
VNGTRTTAAAMAAAALLALPLAGCGKEKPKIPRSAARDLVALLQTVQRQTGAKACTTVERTIESLERRTSALPSKTDDDIRTSLRDGITNLRELVASDCSQVKPKPTTTTEDTTTAEPDTNVAPDTSGGQDTSGGEDQNPNVPPDQNVAPDKGNGGTPTPPGPDTTPDTTPSGGSPSPGQGKKGKDK